MSYEVVNLEGVEFQPKQNSFSSKSITTCTDFANVTPFTELRTSFQLNWELNFGFSHQKMAVRKHKIFGQFQSEIIKVKWKEKTLLYPNTDHLPISLLVVEIGL